MKPVLIIPVHIPADLYMQFKPLVESASTNIFQEWSSWRTQLYFDFKCKLPLVQYYVNGAHVPEIYGYFYTAWLAAKSLQKCQ